MSNAGSNPGVSLQDRDLSLLKGLYESRLMTRKHIAAIYFDGKDEAAKKRVQKLIRVGLIAERARKPYEPAILHLAKPGFDVLGDADALSTYPAQAWKSFSKRIQVSERTLAHELNVMDIKASMAVAVSRHPRFVLAEFTTWPKLYQFRAMKPVIRNGVSRDQEVLMKPDGFIRVHEKDTEGHLEHAFFLELDRSTESLSQLVSKAIGYRDYYRRGGFALRCGMDSRKPSACPFRVLIVVPSVARRDNLKGELLGLNPPIKSQVVIYTQQTFEQDPLALLEA